MPKFNRDILGKLKRAVSEDEIKALLAESTMFEGATPKTQRRQQRFAEKRRKELEEAK